jgi:hypothetical protein
MKDWKYGEEGRAFPVVPESVWRVGQHTLVCSDLMKSDLFARQLTAWPPSLLYCDPPWNQGNVNSFQTKAGLPHAAHSYLDLYTRVISFGRGVRSIPIFIEGGRRQAAKVQALLPGPYRQTWNITYYRRNPCLLHYSGQNSIAGPYFEGLDDDDTPEQAMRYFDRPSDQVVIDPCAGRGLTARVADRVGWISVTNELSPWRTSVALFRLAQQSGKTPARIA